MTRTKLSLIVPLVLVCGCSSDNGSKTDSPVSATDLNTSGTDSPITPPGDGNVKTGDKGRTGDGTVVPKPDGVKPREASTTTTAPGSVCYQTTKTCPTGQICAFLEVWNAPKGTCLTNVGKCSGFDDPRCVVSGHNYSVMCGQYVYNKVSTDVCLLVCEWNGKKYDCPPNHTCKLINKILTCIPQ